MKQYNVIIAGGITAIVLMVVVFGVDIVKFSIHTEEYSIFVDPILDKQSLFVMGRVTVQNTGSQSLTNIHVNFGAGDTIDIKTLKAGQKIILSPPPDNPMEFVMISADNDIFVSKAYREMPKMDRYDGVMTSLLSVKFYHNQV